LSDGEAGSGFVCIAPRQLSGDDIRASYLAMISMHGV
jgi:hypothetical protein